MSEYEISSFTHMYERFCTHKNTDIPENTIEPVTDVPHESSLIDGDTDALRRTAVVKLNGGIGTTMGLSTPKSSLVAHDSYTFLEIAVRQIQTQREKYDVPLPFILLNSPATRDLTMQAIDTLGLSNPHSIPCAIEQGSYPRLDAHTFEPARWESNPSLEWAPGGHGDIYNVLDRTGMIDMLLEAGYEYLFVSNIDNTGAVAAPHIAHWFATAGAPFAAEVARRTSMDMKGGHFARRRGDGQIILREVAQCPDEDIPFFQDITRHTFMNTNNLWIHVPALRAQLDSEDGLALPLIVNHKRIDPKDSTSLEVIQLESAMGAAVSIFEGSRILEVGRERFVPVKSTSDLLLLRSDVFELDDENRLVQCVSERPTVSLDSEFFKRYDQFEQRIPEIPSLREATSFTVCGDVSVPRGYIARGDARLEA